MIRTVPIVLLLSGCVDFLATAEREATNQAQQVRTESLYWDMATNGRLAELAGRVSALELVLAHPACRGR